MKGGRGALESIDKPEGRYMNYFKIGHNLVEFVFDFGQYYTEKDGAKLSTRIVTTPTHAKALLQTLNNSIKRYEKDFGKIRQE